MAILAFPRVQADAVRRRRKAAVDIQAFGRELRPSRFRDLPRGIARNQSFPTLPRSSICAPVGARQTFSGKKRPRVRRSIVEAKAGPGRGRGKKRRGISIRRRQPAGIEGPRPVERALERRSCWGLPFGSGDVSQRRRGPWCRGGRQPKTLSRSASRYATDDGFYVDAKALQPSPRAPGRTSTAINRSPAVSRRRSPSETICNVDSENAKPALSEI